MSEYNNNFVKRLIGIIDDRKHNERGYCNFQNHYILVLQTEDRSNERFYYSKTIALEYWWKANYDFKNQKWIDDNTDRIEELKKRINDLIKNKKDLTVKELLKTECGETTFD